MCIMPVIQDNLYLALLFYFTAWNVVFVQYAVLSADLIPDGLPKTA